MKIKLLTLTPLLFTFPLIASAQTDSTKNWKTDIQSGVNLNQASYSDNWKAGGVNSVAVSAFFNGKAVRTTARNEWSNDLQLLYGNVKNKGQSLRKNADRIFFESKYAHKLTSTWNLFGSINFMSQFDAGFEYPTVAGVEMPRRISGFMSPAYLTEALGLEYKPVTYFSAQLGVGALRQTFVTDQSLYNRPDTTYAELFGVKRGDNMRNQVVFQLVANFDKEILKNIVLKARYMGLLDYARLDPQYIVSRLDVSLTAKVNRFVSTNVTGVLLFDHDQDKDLQYSQVLSLGVLYTFSNYK